MKWLGLDAEDRIEGIKSRKWFGERYEPVPPKIYRKGYYCKWNRKWVFYPVPLCWAVRLLNVCYQKIRGGDG